MDYLYRVVETFPPKAGPENLMQINHLLPGAFEFLDIQISMNGEDQLLYINARLGTIKGMEEHPLLKRREGIGIHDVLRFGRSVYFDLFSREWRHGFSLLR
jgi:hypothetical protein